MVVLKGVQGRGGFAPEEIFGRHFCFAGEVLLASIEKRQRMLLNSYYAQDSSSQQRIIKSKNVNSAEVINTAL